MFVYLAAVIAVLIASQLVGGGAHNGNDYFTADKAWWYITLLTIGYLVSRGLAKSAAAPGKSISAPIPVPADLAPRAVAKRHRSRSPASRQ